MGERIRPGTEIRDFEPDDSKSEMYLKTDFSSISFQEIWEKCREKWPGIKMDEIHLDAQHIQTECLGYGRYDRMDYTNFICITSSSEYFERMKKPTE